MDKFKDKNWKIYKFNALYSFFLLKEEIEK